MIKAKTLPNLEWYDLQALQMYAAVSERTLREWIHRSEHPLPAVQVDKKILVRKVEFDRWLEAHKIESSALDINSVVDELVDELFAEKKDNGRQT